MNPRFYTVAFEGVAVTATQDFFELTPGDDKPIAICGLFIGQTSDFGDAQDEILRYQIVRGNSTSGSGGGTNPTPRPLNPSDAAATFTCEINNTTPASAGTPVILHTNTFNVRVGENLWLPAGMWWGASQANTTLCVRLATAPADSLTVSGLAYVAEFG